MLTSNQRNRDSRFFRASDAAQPHRTLHRGAKLMMLEAMKTQSNIYAPILRRIIRLSVTLIQHGEAEDLLVSIAP